MSSQLSAPVTRIELRAPYLLFLADIAEPAYAKTGLGVAQWCPDKCVGQLRLPGCAVDAGLPDLDLESAVARGARSILLGVAPVGGGLKESWVRTLVHAASLGLDVVSGMHARLASIPDLVEAARTGGARLIDVRVPPTDIPIASGRRRSGRRLLTVGTDCAVGKKYTALAIVRELHRRNVEATFRATGQTGIMIAGAGIPIDAVVCDFTAGAAEVLSPDNAPGHWDVIEGQGSLFHPAYAGVSLGLLHGSQPDALVLCHDPMRTAHAGFPAFELPALQECIDLHLRLARRVNPAVRCVGISLNTSKVPLDGRSRLLDLIRQETDLPCVDPLVEGTSAFVEALLAGDNA